MQLQRSRRALVVTVLAIVASLGLGAVAVAATRGIALVPSVKSTTLLPGLSRTVKITVNGTSGYSGPVTLSLSATRPAGVTLALSSTSTRTGSYRNLTIRTSASSPATTFTIKVKGVSGDFTATTSVTVTISKTGLPLKLAMAGAVTVPGPGQSVPVDVRITNPNPLPVRVSRIVLTVSGVRKDAGAPADMPCSTADFTAASYSGGQTASIAAGATALLSSLVPDRRLWPRLVMVNAPTNQDGCRGAALTLSLAGGGVG